MVELKPCPFCGGKARISFKDHRFYGQNYIGDKKLSYRVQVICNKCRSRGRPVFTDPMINPNPYLTKWGNTYSEDSPKCQSMTADFEPYVEQAIEAWNRRANDAEIH